MISNQSNPQYDNSSLAVSQNFKSNQNMMSTQQSGFRSSDSNYNYQSNQFQQTQEYQSQSNSFATTKMRPEYPKIVDSVMPLMYDSTYGNKQTPTSQSKYKFQEAGTPILIHYKALQNKLKNQQIPVGILVDYFRQWSSILKNQIEEIVFKLLERAESYSERAILLFQDVLTYNTKYMRYITLSIAPSKEIHPSHHLTKIDQTLAMLSIKLQTCQHCFDFTLECEDYVEKMLGSEKKQPKVSVQKDIRQILEKYKSLIADAECKQIFKKYNQQLTYCFLEQFASQSSTSKKTFNEYHEYRRQVGKFTNVDLMDTKSYDQADAISVFSIHLPKGDSIIDGLFQIENNLNFSATIRKQAASYREDMENINEKLMGSMKHAPYLMLETLEHFFSSKFCLNMNIENAEKEMDNQFQNNLLFLHSIIKKLPALQDKFYKYMSQQEIFNKKWKDLVSFCKFQLDPFIETLKNGNPDQQLFIDTDQTQLFNDLIKRGQLIEQKYLNVWSHLGELRKELDMKVDLFADDKEVIKRELEFLNKITKTSADLKDILYQSPFLTQDPISLMDIQGFETQRDNLNSFSKLLTDAQHLFEDLKQNNLLNTIFKKLTQQDPLLHSLLKKKMLSLISTFSSTNSKQSGSESIKEKIDYYFIILQQIDASQLQDEEKKKMKDCLSKLFRNLVYCDLKQSFKYEVIPQMKEKLQKSIADILQTDTQVDQNEYHSKAVLVSFSQIKELLKLLDNFDYPDFQNMYTDIERINNTFIIYNSVIGKANVHVEIQKLKKVMDSTYQYFFLLQNPPVHSIRLLLDSFLLELEDNISKVDSFLKSDLTDFEDLSKILDTQHSLLTEIFTQYSKFQEQLQKWALVPVKEMASLIYPISNWFVNLHQKVFIVESKKRSDSPFVFMVTCEEKEEQDALITQFIKNKFFGLHGGITKGELERLKSNLTPTVQDKYLTKMSWAQRPRKVKILLDFCLPFHTFRYKISVPNSEGQQVVMLQKKAESLNSFKTIRGEVELEMSDVYQNIQVELEADDQSSFKRINYKREIIVSGMERETRIILNELGVQFKENEKWKIYIKNQENIMWNPYLKVGEMSVPNPRGEVYIDFIEDIDVKQNQWENLELTDFHYGSYEYSIFEKQKPEEKDNHNEQKRNQIDNHNDKEKNYVRNSNEKENNETETNQEQNEEQKEDIVDPSHKNIESGTLKSQEGEDKQKTPKHIYFLVIECDGCEKDLLQLDHKIFVSGNTGSQLSQSCTYSMIDSQSVRKDRSIWMLGYIKEDIYYKINKFVSRAHLDEILIEAFHPTKDIDQKVQNEQPHHY